MLTANVALAELAKFPSVDGEPERFKARFDGGEVCFTVPPVDVDAWLAAVGQGKVVHVIVATAPEA